MNVFTMGGSGSLSTHLLSSLSSLISLTQTIFNNVALPTPQESRPLSRSPPSLKLKKMGFSSLTKAWQAVWLSDLNFIWLNCISPAIVAITPSRHIKINICTIISPRWEVALQNKSYLSTWAENVSSLICGCQRGHVLLVELMSELIDWLGVRSESKSVALLAYFHLVGVILLCIRCVTESDLNTKAMSWHGMVCLAAWLFRKLRDKDGESYPHGREIEQEIWSHNRRTVSVGGILNSLHFQTWPEKSENVV